MIDFAFKHVHSEKEEKALYLYSVLQNDVKIHYFKKAEQVPEGFIPVGVIDWVTRVLGFVPTPDYYPVFLKHLLYRKVWRTDTWPLEKDIFIKPYDKPKRFQARITTGTYKGKKKGPYWCSEKVVFVNEWRYYVANGKVLYAGWYMGNNDDAVPPVFDESVIPNNWCGAIDMGILSTGEFALIEAAEPYSIGWYGRLSEGAIYANFIIEGWKYLQSLFGNTA
jgi:hypothetical protein